jgi:DNA-binding CsgD family transcriptional regulator
VSHMDEVTREAVGDILRSTQERVRRASDLLEPDSPAAHELSVAQRLIDACLQAITSAVSVPSLTVTSDTSSDGDAVHYRNRSDDDLLLLSPLTLREEEVLRLVSDGLRNKEIAARLGISERTATFHVGNVLSKLGADGRVEAIHIARQRGLL